MLRRKTQRDACVTDANRTAEREEGSNDPAHTIEPKMEAQRRCIACVDELHLCEVTAPCDGHPTKFLRIRILFEVEVDLFLVWGDDGAL